MQQETSDSPQECVWTCRALWAQGAPFREQLMIGDGNAGRLCGRAGSRTRHARLNRLLWERHGSLAGLKRAHALLPGETKRAKTERD